MPTGQWVLGSVADVPSQSMLIIIRWATCVSIRTVILHSSLHWSYVYFMAQEVDKFFEGRSEDDRAGMWTDLKEEILIFIE